MSNDNFSENEAALQRLLSYFSSRGINQAKFIEKTGYSSGQASAIFNKKANLSRRLVKTICSAFSISEEWLLHGKGRQATSADTTEIEESGGYIAAVAAMMREMDEETQKDIFLSVQKEKLLRELLTEREEKKMG